MTGFRLLLSFSQLHEAHMAKGYLQSEGIGVILEGEYMTQIHSFYANAAGGVKLLVSEGDYERGLELLKEGGFIKSKDDQQKLAISQIKVNEASDITHCPFCHSDNFMITKAPAKGMIINLLMLLVVGVLPIIVPIYNRYYKCFDCGNEWKFIK